MSDKLDIIKRYAPSLITTFLERHPGVPREPHATSFPAAVMFADISGFTALTEKFTRDNPSGITDLANILDIYIGRLVDIITSHGGDVVKFAGDALFAIWRVPAESSLDIETHRAVKCGVIIQNQLHNLKVASGVSLSLRVGLGTGEMHALHIGGTFDRWELLITGDPMNQVAIAGKEAEPGEVVISPQVRRRLEAVNGGRREANRFKLSSIKETEKSTPLLKPPITPELDRALRAFIPRAIIASLDEGSNAWNADLRRVTVVFVNVKGLRYTKETPVAHIQKIMRAIQKCLYRHEGSINRFGVDDKGAILLAAFGLPPLGHDDDPRRGLLAARDLREELALIGHDSVVGIATGRVFCGSVGNETRSEYTMHGRNVNLAARLMQAAETVLCDENTYEDVKDEFEFDAKPPTQVKGRDEPVRVYQPHYPESS